MVLEKMPPGLDLLKSRQQEIDILLSQTKEPNWPNININQVEMFNEVAKAVTSKTGGRLPPQASYL
jgi:hypothetical protein